MSPRATLPYHDDGWDYYYFSLVNIDSLHMTHIFLYTLHYIYSDSHTRSQISSLPEKYFLCAYIFFLDMLSLYRCKRTMIFFGIVMVSTLMICDLWQTSTASQYSTNILDDTAKMFTDLCWRDLMLLKKMFERFR